VSTRCFEGCCEDGEEFVRLGEQRAKSTRGNDFAFDEELEPEDGFVCFFDNDSDLGDEFFA
jgi:hypothetical protein